MIDSTKATSKNQTCISKLYSYAEKNLKPHKPQNNNYLAFSNGSNRFRIEFRKITYQRKLIGFYQVEVCFSPHYIINNDWHNGNDLTPVDCIKTIIETFAKIGVSESELAEFKVCNLEYGLNLSTGIKIEKLIDGILYTKKAPFLIPNPKIKYSKISDTSKYKLIKVYGKGIQCHDELNAPHIDRNTFRFEVKSKQSKWVDKIGIPHIHDPKYGVCLIDLLKVENYSILFQSLLDEWENILVINLEQKDATHTAKFWSEILEHQDRNKFYKTKLKYCENSSLKTNLHHIIKCKIIDKIIELQKGANSTEKTPINVDNIIYGKTSPLLINLEYAPHHICKVTGLDISMQKKESKFLFNVGLEHYKENDLKTYENIIQKFWSANCKGQTDKKLHTIIAHNIRNLYNNQKYSKEKNINPNQLAMFTS